MAYFNITRQPRSWVHWFYAYVRYVGVAGVACVPPLRMKGCVPKIVFFSSLLVLNSNEGNRLGFTNGICLGWIIWETVLSHTLELSAEYILLLRGTYPSNLCFFRDNLIVISLVYILYNKSKALLWVLSSIFIAEAIALTAIEIYSVAKVVYNLEIGCIVTSTRPVYVALWYEHHYFIPLVVTHYS